MGKRIRMRKSREYYSLGVEKEDRTVLRHRNIVQPILM